MDGATTELTPERTRHAGKDDCHRISNADAYREEAVPKAKGEAWRLAAEAEGYRARVTNQAAGEAEHFNRLRREYARHPDVTASRLYLESMERLLPNMRVIVADESGNRPLDLSIVRNRP